MTESKIRRYLAEHPTTRDAVHSVLLNEGAITGSDLVDKHLVPMIDAIYTELTELVSPQSLTADQAAMYILELGVFARYNSDFLRRAADSVQGFCFELAHELRRNHLEEGGDRGRIPAHYTLYSGALLADLGLLINGHVPARETETLVALHDWMVSGSSPSRILGGYYATEGVAIHETRLLQAITDRYGDLTVGKHSGELPALDYYYALHLEDDHEAAEVAGLSVEAAHIEGIAAFIRQAELYHFDLPQVLDGWLQIAEGMTQWWTGLIARAHRIP